MTVGMLRECKVKYLIFFDFVTTCEIHLHSRSCGKYKNQACRYHFGKFFTKKKTIIAQPLPKEMFQE